MKKSLTPVSVEDTVYYTRKGILCTGTVYTLKNKEFGVQAEINGHKQFTNVPYSKIVARIYLNQLEIINKQLYDKFGNAGEFPIP